MTGKEALAQMLAAEGVEYIFGNPGTSETPFLDVLQDYPNLQYIQALQEGTAVGMADGYARAAGKPAFANIHIAGGLANGMSALYNAYRGGTPLVLTAGNSDTRMLLSDPVLSGDLVEMTQQFTKWSAEIPQAENIPMAVRRAFKEAMTPPVGPVFLSFPWDTMDEEVDVDITPSSTGYYRMGPDPAAISSAVELLARAENPVVVIGDRVGQSGGGAELVRVAEQLGARVYASSYTYSEISFPLNHGQYAGMLNLNSSATRRQLAEADVVLAVGTNVFSSFLYVSEPFLSPATKLVHMDNDLKEIEKIYPTNVGIPCDPKAGLAELADALDQEMTASAREAAATRAATLGEARRQAREEYLGRMQSMPDTRPMPVDRMMYELAQALPDNAVIADEAITSRGALLQALEPSVPGSYYAIRGGALGWAMPGALGIKLANPDRPVVAVVGDGASMYTVQA
ncbi:MAG: thiamine pyrophosphate-binding protein, partial [Chloroflexota bacterium]|nr:thiamine pyrophosphate-binding protein [Chloroflexota bacterium]